VLPAHALSCECCQLTAMANHIDHSHIALPRFVEQFEKDKLAAAAAAAAGGTTARQPSWVLNPWPHAIVPLEPTCSTAEGFTYEPHEHREKASMTAPWPCGGTTDITPAQHPSVGVPTTPDVIAATIASDEESEDSGSEDGNNTY
jgi:hypothetical protein